MIKLYKHAELGKANHGWLKANYHFSFAHYYNSRRMGFGALRVINDDWVESGRGIPPHPHKNMEIITFVRTGSVTHEDSAGNNGTTKSGEVQVMSAGSGITHSEYNRSNGPLTLYQIWIEPNEHNVKPRWDTKSFPSKVNNNGLSLLVSGYPEDKNEALFIHQEARIYGGKVTKGSRFEHPITHQAYVLASSGRFEIITDKAVILNKGDGAEVTKTASMEIIALEDCEILVIDTPQS
ncbi:pirin family protein [Shewanella gelidimarina]|uniref:pirin family protein n=1 Tax=Shewanella gelidimarina TaxID=56813 RepID=UPI00200C9C0A|nr:pirin family protein [Shewanella gelidimarina]MCL1059253.1 pirin family protein [Shewanella gelidimarina]